MSSPTLILLPGLHGTDELWPPLLSLIPPDLPRIIVSYPTDQILSRNELLHLIEQTVPPDRPLLLIAESFSGPLAVEFAARHPDRVLALVLGATFVTPPLPTWLCRHAAFIAQHFLSTLMHMRSLLPDRIADATVGRASRDALRNVRPAVVASRLRIIAETDCRHLLPNCRMPLLYLQAARDIVVPPRCFAQIQALCPHARLHQLQCSHMLFQRKPREAWTAIAPLLE